METPITISPKAARASSWGRYQAIAILAHFLGVATSDYAKAVLEDGIYHLADLQPLNCRHGLARLRSSDAAIPIRDGV
jgi:hypothetical protein